MPQTEQKASCVTANRLQTSGSAAEREFKRRKAAHDMQKKKDKTDEQPRKGKGGLLERMFGGEGGKR
tara:strand:+ start:5987 stop:6187 length:201 start_codon:yes stop_codon:yes gene_type:complete